MVLAILSVNKKEKKKNHKRKLPTVILLCLFSFMLFSFSGNGAGDGRRWILFAEASTGNGAGRTGSFLGIGGGGGGFWASAAPSNVAIAVAVTAMAGIALAATVVYSRRGSLKSPWSRRRRKHALLPKQWKRFFTPDGKLTDGGVKFLKKARSGGVDPSIRAEVWPFLLGVYEVNSTKEERDAVRSQKREEYENLRKRCRKLLQQSEKSSKLKETSGISSNEGSGEFSQVLDSPGSKLKETSGISSNEGSGEFSQVLDSRGLDEVISARKSNSSEDGSPLPEDPSPPGLHKAFQTSGSLCEGDGENHGVTCEDIASAGDSESSDSDSSEEPENTQSFLRTVESEENDHEEHAKDDSSPSNSENESKFHTAEDFATWQRIIRLDAVRANDEWITYSPSQAGVTELKAQCLAQCVGLKDYDHLEPCRIFHAARLVAILEAYAMYDPEIGYCQGMSDLLTPIISVVEEDHEAFWCFVGFMKRARHNFRLDEVGIHRQLSTVSKIIKGKDIHLYRHLEKLQAEDCFFVYRMVVVLFRRELTFEQTLCLWEVIWADQAAIRAGIGKSAWGRMRPRAPPTEDLLLYAIAACVLQRRKLIIEKYSSMEEIMRECNSMAGHLDVWKLLDDAHDLVVTLHDKI